MTGFILKITKVSSLESRYSLSRHIYQVIRVEISQGDEQIKEEEATQQMDVIKTEEPPYIVMILQITTKHSLKLLVLCFKCAALNRKMF